MPIRSLFLKSALVLGIWTQSASPVLADQARVVDALQQALDAIGEAIEALKEERRQEANPPTKNARGLTATEADALRLGIQQCWNIGVLSKEAQQVTATVGFSLTPEARHEQGSIRLISASGGSEIAVQQAFEAARRAIIRCEGDGYGLPPEKFDAWRDVTITFNPEGMRLR